MHGVHDLRDFRVAVQPVILEDVQEIKNPATYSRTFGTTIGFKSRTTVFGIGTGVGVWI